MRKIINIVWSCYGWCSVKKVFKGERHPPLLTVLLTESQLS